MPSTVGGVDITEPWERADQTNLIHAYKMEGVDSGNETDYGSLGNRVDLSPAQTPVAGTGAPDEDGKYREMLRTSGTALSSSLSSGDWMYDNYWNWPQMTLEAVIRQTDYNRNDVTGSPLVDRSGLVNYKDNCMGMMTDTTTSKTGDVGFFFSFYDGSSFNTRVIQAWDSGNGFAYDTWVHIAATFDLVAGAGNSTAKLYLNGTESKSETFTQTNMTPIRNASSSYRSAAIMHGRGSTYRGGFDIAWTAWWNIPLTTFIATGGGGASTVRRERGMVGGFGGGLLHKDNKMVEPTMREIIEINSGRY